MSKHVRLFAILSLALAVMLIVSFRKRQRQTFTFLRIRGGEMVRTINMANINEIMPDWNKQITSTEFIEERRLKNDDKPFSTLLSQMPSSDGCYETLVSLFGERD